MRDYRASPFPGMNPYLEGPVNWSDFHATLIHTLREAINDQLPEPYNARVGELVMMVAPEQPERQTREPDVFVNRDPDAGPSARPVAVAPPTALLEPIILAHVEHLDPHTELFIEILRMPERDVVTVVELFSPTNKYGAGRAEYGDKRAQLLRTSANIVELDLLRAGGRLPLSKPLPRDDYFCFVSRGDRRPLCDVYHWSVRDPLPRLPIPLRPPDPDVWVDLGEPFRTAFSRGQYGRYVDYAKPPPPPTMAPADLDWLMQTAREAATR